MARGGEIAYESKTRNKVRLGKRGSDESDEDYTVGEDEEFVESEDEYCSSLADDETEESLGEFEEEEEEEDEELEEERGKKRIKKVGRPRGPKSSRRGKNDGVVIPRKKKTAYSEEEGEDHDDDDFAGAKRTKKSILSHNEKDDDMDDRKPRKRTRVWSTGKHADRGNEKTRKKTRVSYQEEEEDGDDNDLDDDDDDEEFTPDDVDDVDDDDDLPDTKKIKVDRLRVQEARISRGKERKRNAKALKRTQRKKPRKKQNSRRNTRSHGKEIKDGRPIVQKKKKITKKVRERRKSSAISDSDFVSSGSSDYEYTVSEEEREQVREASEFCRRLATSLRSSSSLKMIEEEETMPSQRKCQGRKGKEKVVDMTVEVGKQVCGICLSKEGKRTVRGILNCCSHYFCFACIMEWSKVESRCPLCKQRFATISRTTRADGGHDLRDAVITVPERDQVYQPSEEELRGYLDPYESVLCTECHQGGDDALMLLCDLCNSPAHTYCVGLGREVPEGNWYCDGCKPTALAASNPALNPTPNHGANNNLSVGSSPVATVRETFDLNELYIPETSLTQVNGHFPSPRNPIGDSQVASPSFGTGAFTLYERRRIQRQIHQLLNNRSRQLDRSDGAASLSGISLFGSQISREAVVAPQHAVPVRVPPQNIYHQGRLPEHTAPSLYGGEALSQRLSSLREQVPYHQASTSAGHSFGGISHSEFSGTPTGIGQDLGHQQFHPCNIRSNIGVDAGIPPPQFREVSLSSLEKERVQSMVKSHLKSLSRNLDLGYTTFKHIARTSTHTILAALGLEHRWNELYPVRTRPLLCDHFDRSASRQTRPVSAQCSSCFDIFVRNVVKEIMSTRVPQSATD